MDHFKSAASLFSLFFILVSISAGVLATDEGSCGGPTVYYEDLGCTPLYRSSGDPCPFQYDCGNLPQKSSYDCYENNTLPPSHEFDYSCAPTYLYTQSPQRDCTTTKRCQNDRDKVIRKNRAVGPVKSNETLCVFGTLWMRHGDELNVATSPTSACMHCVCEVGPTPTCQRFPPERCVVKYLPRIPSWYIPQIYYPRTFG